MIVAKATKILVPSPPVKDLRIILNRKLGFLLNDAAVKDRKLIDQVIQGGPKVVDAVTDRETERERNEERTIEGYCQVLRRSRIVLDENFVYIRLPEGHEPLTYFIVVFYCPFYPKGSSIERM